MLWHTLRQLLLPQALRECDLTPRYTRGSIGWLRYWFPSGCWLFGMARLSTD